LGIVKESGRIAYWCEVVSVKAVNAPTLIEVEGNGGNQGENQAVQAGTLRGVFPVD
jgi:hypothetical protein